MSITDRVTDLIILCVALVLSHLELARRMVMRVDRIKVEEKEWSDSDEESEEKVRRGTANRSTHSIFYTQLQSTTDAVLDALTSLLVSTLTAALLLCMLTLDWTARALRRVLRR